MSVCLMIVKLANHMYLFNQCEHPVKKEYIKQISRPTSR